MKSCHENFDSSGRRWIHELLQKSPHENCIGVRSGDWRNPRSPNPSFSIFRFQQLPAIFPTVRRCSVMLKPQPSCLTAEGISSSDSVEQFTWSHDTAQQTTSQVSDKGSTTVFWTIPAQMLTLKKTWHPRSRPEVTVRKRPAVTCAIHVSRLHCSNRQYILALAWSGVYSRTVVLAPKLQVHRIRRVCVPREFDQNWTLRALYVLRTHDNAELCIIVTNNTAEKYVNAFDRDVCLETKRLNAYDV
jgi:hypothetical protein